MHQKNIIELLLHIDFNRRKSPAKAEHYTKFDAATITSNAMGTTFCRYMMPMYTFVCSWADAGGVTVGVADLRKLLDVEAKYSGFDNFNKKVLKHVQKEMEIRGNYKFNYTLVKSGRTVTKIVFKIFANKKMDPNHVWIRLQKALTQELPYFARFTEAQRDEFNYLLTGTHDLEKVLAKFQHIHKHLVRHKEQGAARRDPFEYTRKAIYEQFPPG